jgi:prophage endopeptidase
MLMEGTMTALLIKYWKPLAMMLALLLIWLHGDHNGSARENRKWEFRSALIQKANAEETARLERKYRKMEQDWQTAADLLATEAYTDLKEKERENDKLRAAVAAGTVRLRLKATCPEVPGAAASGEPGPVDNGVWPELDAAAGPAYFSLRSGIIRKEAQLSACQGLLRLRSAEAK